MKSTSDEKPQTPTDQLSAVADKFKQFFDDNPSSFTYNFSDADKWLTEIDDEITALRKRQGMLLAMKKKATRESLFEKLQSLDSEFRSKLAIDTVRFARLLDICVAKIEQSEKSSLEIDDLMDSVGKILDPEGKYDEDPPSLDLFDQIFDPDPPLNVTQIFEKLIECKDPIQIECFFIMSIFLMQLPEEIKKIRQYCQHMELPDTSQPVSYRIVDSSRIIGIACEEEFLTLSQQEFNWFKRYIEQLKNEFQGSDLKDTKREYAYGYEGLIPREHVEKHNRAEILGNIIQEYEKVRRAFFDTIKGFHKKLEGSLKPIVFDRDTQDIPLPMAHDFIHFFSELMSYLEGAEEMITRIQAPLFDDFTDPLDTLKDSIRNLLNEIQLYFLTHKKQLSENDLRFIPYLPQIIDYDQKSDAYFSTISYILSPLTRLLEQYCNALIKSIEQQTTELKNMPSDKIDISLVESKQRKLLSDMEKLRHLYNIDFQSQKVSFHMGMLTKSLSLCLSVWTAEMQWLLESENDMRKTFYFILLAIRDGHKPHAEIGINRILRKEANQLASSLLADPPSDLPTFSLLSDQDLAQQILNYLDKFKWNFLAEASSFYDDFKKTIQSQTFKNPITLLYDIVDFYHVNPKYHDNKTIGTYLAIVLRELVELFPYKNQFKLKLEYNESDEFLKRPHYTPEEFAELRAFARTREVEQLEIDDGPDKPGEQTWGWSPRS